MDYPALQVNVNRARASELGLNPQEVIDNLITSLTSNAMIAPGYWVDPKSGNNYFVTVQYPENQVKSIEDLKAMPLARPRLETAHLSQSSRGRERDAIPDRSGPLPTAANHGHLRGSLRRGSWGSPPRRFPRSSPDTKLPPNLRINMRGLVVTMQNLLPQLRDRPDLLAILLVYLVLVAQFTSFTDPFLIVLAVPTGLVGVIITLALTGTTLNIQSLMGIVMLQGMVVSNSILIVDFANVLRSEGRSVVEAVADACRIRLRPILMTSLATVVGPAADGFQTGNGQRSVCAAGAGHHRRPDLFHPADNICGAGCVLVDLPASRSIGRRSRH